MKTSTKQTRISQPIYRNIAIALAVASVVGGTSMTLALAKDHDDRGRHGDKGWHKGWDRGEERGYRDDRQYRYRPVYQEQEPYYYSRPVYVPPPVYYPPHPSLGVSLFFPIDLR